MAVNVCCVCVSGIATQHDIGIEMHIKDLNQVFHMNVRLFYAIAYLLLEL